MDVYLKGRGLALGSYPPSLRCHPALPFFETGSDGRPVAAGKHAAMVARVDNAHGQLCAVHRTWLKDGRKLPHPHCRKLLGSARGGAVRLGEAGTTLAIAEGIETALAVQLLTGSPVWAALSAGNLERLQLPEDLHRVAIHGDNDAGFQGQFSAYALARRLRQERPDVSLSIDVRIPAVPRQDWADVWTCLQQQAVVSAPG